MKKNQFLPMYPHEVSSRGWERLDVIIITGDAYVDHPSYGASLIGRLLESRGFKVGIIAQPDWNSLDDFRRLGRPRLCFAITAGNVDSMIANYTANKKKRNDDDYSPDSKAGLRPDRASIVYANRVRAAFKEIPIVLGGIEASLRRLAHYDYWDNKVRRSLLLDAKADILIYGMGERPIIELVQRLDKGESVKDIHNINGTVVSLKKEHLPTNYILLPSFEEVTSNHSAFNRAFCLIHNSMANGDKTLVQKHAERYIVQLPPAGPLNSKELDESYELPYVRRPHPSYGTSEIKGFEMVLWSLTAVRGCPGDCSFCGITLHQGRILQSRSENSVLKEAKIMISDPDFRGTISDIGGPTANLFSASCARWDKGIACENKQCLMPHKCPSLKLAYANCLKLYDSIAALPKVKHVFISSGIRYDLLLDKEADRYLEQLCKKHISGQMKVAPEHTDDNILRLMNKPSHSVYESFEKKFNAINGYLKKRTFLVNYFISSHPGCKLNDAFHCAIKLLNKKIRPEQVQDYLPLPMTLSACLYHTGRHPYTGERVHVPKNSDERSMHRALMQSNNPNNRPYIIKALTLLKKRSYAERFGIKLNRNIK
jgi:uncharacterized radical SAM protein YgiQ